MHLPVLARMPILEGHSEMIEEDRLRLGSVIGSGRVPHDGSEGDVMTEKWVHPTVRRGTIWWTMQALAYGGVTLALVFVAFWKPSTGTTIAAVVAVPLGPLLIFMAIKQVKVLRHEYRYTDEQLEAPE